MRACSSRQPTVLVLKPDRENRKDAMVFMGLPKK